MASLLTDEHAREGQLAWWSTHCRSALLASGKAAHRYWTDDWLLNRKLAAASSRLLLARILSPSAQLPYSESQGAGFAVAVTRCCSLHGVLAYSAVKEQPAASEGQVHTAAHWLIRLWCSYLPDPDVLSSADRKALVKLKRRKSSKLAQINQLKSMTSAENAAMEQRLRAANFSQDPAEIKTALRASQDIGYHGLESREYRRGLKLLQVIELESDADSGVGPGVGRVESGLCSSPGPVAECFGQRSSGSEPRPCFSPLERARLDRADRQSPWLRHFGYETVTAHPARSGDGLAASLPFATSDRSDSGAGVRRDRSTGSQLLIDEEAPWASTDIVSRARALLEQNKEEETQPEEHRDNNRPGRRRRVGRRLRFARSVCQLPAMTTSDAVARTRPRSTAESTAQTSVRPFILTERPSVPPAAVRDLSHTTATVANEVGLARQARAEKLATSDSDEAARRLLMGTSPLRVQDDRRSPAISAGETVGDQAESSIANPSDAFAATEPEPEIDVSSSDNDDGDTIHTK